MENRITKSEKYTMLENILLGLDGDDIDMLLEFVQAENAALARKAAKAKETAAEKKAEMDDLGHAVWKAVTIDPQTGDQIFEAVDFPDATIAKVRARLSKLADAGYVVREDVKVTNASGKKVTRVAYTLATMTSAD